MFNRKPTLDYRTRARLAAIRAAARPLPTLMQRRLTVVKIEPREFSAWAMWGKEGHA